MDNGQLKLARAAVIIVDVQNDFCHSEGAQGRKATDLSMVEAMANNLEALVNAARAAKIPVIFIQTIHEDATDSPAWRRRSDGSSGQNCRKGTWGADFYRVMPLDHEPVVVKHRYSAFVNTRLDTVLRTLSVQTLIMTGVATNVCVESTARDGFMRDYHIALVGDACAAYSERAHEMTLENIERHFGTTTTTREVTAILAALSTSAESITA